MRSGQRTWNGGFNLSKAKASERQLQEAVAEHFRKQGYVVMPEMQFFTKRIDLYAVHRVSLATVAIETKIHDWKRALFQARIYLLCADRVFVAMPSSLAHNIAAEGFSRDAVGLLAIETSEAPALEWAVSIVIPAPKSMRKKKQYADRLQGTVLFARFDEGGSQNAG